MSVHRFGCAELRRPVGAATVCHGECLRAAVPATEDDVSICDSLDEAIAEAVAASEPGDEVIVHAATCEAGLDGDGCTCTPDAFVVPEAAIA